MVSSQDLDHITHSELVQKFGNIKILPLLLKQKQTAIINANSYHFLDSHCPYFTCQLLLYIHYSIVFKALNILMYTWRFLAFIPSKGKQARSVLVVPPLSWRDKVMKAFPLLGWSCLGFLFLFLITVLLKKKLADESNKKQELQNRLLRLQNDLIKVGFDCLSSAFLPRNTEINENNIHKVADLPNVCRMN